MKKRKEAYHNEFKMAKQLSQQQYDEEDEENNIEEMRNQTLKNTLFNKFYGQVEKNAKK